MKNPKSDAWDPSIRALTFDCYGTIIDWDGGIRQALGQLPELASADLDRLLADRERLEYDLLNEAYRPYGEVLGASMQRAAALQGIQVSESSRAQFAASMGTWPAFPDSARALSHLATRFRLALLSNVETETLEQSIAPLGIQFEHLISAESVRSYKPGPAHFAAALERLALEPHEILHVAGSLYHDIRPAQAAGWPHAWINRRSDPIPEGIDPTRVFPDLQSLGASLVDVG